jgi:hypothetical protein
LCWQHPSPAFLPDIKNSYGSWPRAFLDMRNLFLEEKVGLKTLDGATYPHAGNLDALCDYLVKKTYFILA